jgi:hypothetical protein
MLNIHISIDDEEKVRQAQAELDAYSSNPDHDGGCLMTFLSELAEKYGGKLVFAEKPVVH